MRVEEIGDKILTYPDKLTFAFNPNVIRVMSKDGSNQYNNFSFTISGGNYTFTDERSSWDGQVSMDASRYMQVMVDKDNRNTDVTISNFLGTFDFSVIWGAINIGEKFNTSRKLYWYINLPFSFNVYVPEGGVLDKRYIDTEYERFDKGIGLVEINPKDLFYDRKNAFVRMLGGPLTGVFEYTFDYTFLEIDNNSCLIELVPVECTDGIYLRWIDRQGFVQYRLFQRGETSDKSKAKDKIEVEFSDDMPLGGVYRDIEKPIERTIKLGAVNLEPDEFERLKTLGSSVVVDCYSNNTWIPVRIADGTVKYNGGHLYDYECEMVLPTIIGQRL